MALVCHADLTYVRAEIVKLFNVLLEDKRSRFTTAVVKSYFKFGLFLEKCA